jgi:hypothetical protein
MLAVPQLVACLRRIWPCREQIRQRCRAEQQTIIEIRLPPESCDPLHFRPEATQLFPEPLLNIQLLGDGAGRPTTAAVSLFLL